MKPQELKQPVITYLFITVSKIRFGSFFPFQVQIIHVQHGRYGEWRVVIVALAFPDGMKIQLAKLI